MLVKGLFGEFFYHVYTSCYTFFISFDISFDFEIKREKKKVYLLQEKKKGKMFDKHPPGIEPEPVDPMSNALTDCAIEKPYVTRLQVDLSY